MVSISRTAVGSSHISYAQVASFPAHIVRPTVERPAPLRPFTSDLAQVPAHQKKSRKKLLLASPGKISQFLLSKSVITRKKKSPFNYPRNPMSTF
ncbi:hypothetical protein TNIN_409911 [Trichonephila inaurata madagascariensis]|uniref:Uncharacterized protein n=1 Tax=Trichonephila inaurata madagascariensis TaxID=2747483 RepID=A0A8X6MA77_9ARAC|nr:hypothetical protein TNIN_409911 [Trichonephila inaurata madagascariensis]